MKQQFAIFLLRWLLNSFGLWVAFRVFGSGYDISVVDTSIGAFLLAGLIFSLVNSILRPIVIVLSLPAILFTLGLFTFVVNGLMVYITFLIMPGLQMTFWHSVLTGIVLSLINYIVSSVLQAQYERLQKES